jgi:hypothetical protein
MRIGISQPGQNSVGISVTSHPFSLLAQHLRFRANPLEKADQF